MQLYKDRTLCARSLLQRAVPALSRPAGSRRKICRVLMYAAGCCTCSVTSAGLGIIMCRALIDAAGCCASAAASAGLTTMMCQVPI